VIKTREGMWQPAQYNTPERASLLRARLLALMRLTGIFRFAKIFFAAILTQIALFYKILKLTIDY